VSGVDAIFRRTRNWAASSGTVSRWRERRYELFMNLCAVQPDERILDVGAGAGAALERFNRTNPILAVDLEPRLEGTWLDAPNVTVEVADGTCLPYADASFPVVFSNSVLQDMPPAARPAFASEIRRVGARYFVQTPNRYFPIDPIYQLPFFQLLPGRLRRWMTRRLSLGWRGRGTEDLIELVSARELRALFPDAEIHRERVLGLTKSLIAVRR
jgi:SAM-dependent methyltransferase